MDEIIHLLESMKPLEMDDEAMIMLYEKLDMPVPVYKQTFRRRVETAAQKFYRTAQVFKDVARLAGRTS